MATDRAAPLQSDAHARFTDLVRSHQRTLHAHVRFVYPHVDADAVVNEVFAAAWQRLDDIADESAGSWLKATARHVVGNRRRGERRWQALNDKVARLDPVPHAPPPDHDAGLELQLVLDALASLSVADREVLLMTALEDLSPDDLGMILGVSGHTASMRVSRARARLRAAVAAQAEPPSQGGTT